MIKLSKCTLILLFTKLIIFDCHPALRHARQGQRSNPWRLLAMILVCLICLKGHTNWDTLWWLLIVLPFLRMASLNCVPRIEIVFINLLPPVVHSASQALSPTFLACVMNCCTNAGLYCRLHVCTCIHCTCSCVICTPSKNLRIHERNFGY